MGNVFIPKILRRDEFKTFWHAAHFHCRETFNCQIATLRVKSRELEVSLVYSYSGTIIFNIFA